MVTYLSFLSDMSIIYICIIFSGDSGSEESGTLRDITPDGDCPDRRPHIGLHEQLHKPAFIRLSQLSLQEGLQKGRMLWASAPTGDGPPTNQIHQNQHQRRVHRRLVSRNGHFRLRSVYLLYINRLKVPERRHARGV